MLGSHRIGRLKPEKHSGADDATACPLNRKGKLRLRPAGAGQDAVEMAGRSPGLQRHLGNRLARREKSFLESHTKKGNSVTLPCQASGYNCSELRSVQNSGMTKWLQVDRLKNRLKAYQARTGKTQAQVAEDLGTSYGTLRFWLSGTRRPELPTLQKFASVFQDGCTVSEFFDDPGAAPAGIDLSSYSEVDRHRLLRMIQAISDDSLSTEDRDICVEDFLRDIDRLKSLKGKLGKKS